jgi:hypothetical protein
VTPKAGGKVDENQVTQFGRALKELGIKMIPAYSPQARGRMERSYRTWQGRLPQELRLRQITTVEEANQFLRHASNWVRIESLCGWSLCSAHVPRGVRLINLPPGEDQAVLDPHNVQHAIQVEAGRLDLGADLFLGHALRFV